MKAARREISSRAGIVRGSIVATVRNSIAEIAGRAASAAKDVSPTENLAIVPARIPAIGRRAGNPSRGRSAKEAAATSVARSRVSTSRASTVRATTVVATNARGLHATAKTACRATGPAGTGHSASGRSSIVETARNSIVRAVIVMTVEIAASANSIRAASGRKGAPTGRNIPRSERGSSDRFGDRPRRENEDDSKIFAKRPAFGGRGVYRERDTEERRPARPPREKKSGERIAKVLSRRPCAATPRKWLRRAGSP